jgi:hypothetical protein
MTVADHNPFTSLMPGWRDSAKLIVTEVEAQRTIALPFFNNIGSKAINEGLRYAGKN